MTTNVYPKCSCGKLSRIIFFDKARGQVVDACWECFDNTETGREMARK